MKHLAPALAGAAALGGALLAVQPTVPPRPTSASLNTTVSAVFRELNMEAAPRKDDDGSTTYVFKVGETTGQLYQFLDENGRVESIRMSIGYDVPAPLDLKKVNTFNEARRFGKAFSDPDGDPFLVSDLDVQFGVTPGVVRAWMIRYRALVPLFEREVVGRS